MLGNKMRCPGPQQPCLACSVSKATPGGFVKGKNLEGVLLDVIERGAK